MKSLHLVYATLFCICLAPSFTSLEYRPTPSLGASPLLDTTSLRLSENMGVFTKKLLSSEARNLAELAVSGQDFSDWKRTVLARFKIRQANLPRYSNNDKVSDLRQFTRYLNALESEFQERQTQNRANNVKKQRQRGFNYSMQLMQKALQKYRLAGDQYHDLQGQQADLFSDCAEIGGAVGGGDLNSGEGTLINLIPSPTNNVPVILPQVAVVPPSSWGFPSSNYVCIGPLGPIDTSNSNRDSYAYPDRSCKLGVLYDKIVDLCYDYSYQNSNSDYNDRVLQSYKLQWSNLVMKYTRCAVRYNQLEQKKNSVQTRLSDLSSFIQGINSPSPADGWQESFLDNHGSIGPNSQLYNGDLRNILI